MVFSMRPVSYTHLDVYKRQEYNQLVCVIPPLAALSTFSLTDNIFNDLCYQYKYDVQNRLVEKKLPGKGWEYMVYDKQDRLVATQDANLGLNKQWLFTKYDQFGRVVYTGIKNLDKSRTAYQTDVDANGANNESRNDTGFDNSTLKIYYSKSNAYPCLLYTSRCV